MDAMRKKTLDAAEADADQKLRDIWNEIKEKAADALGFNTQATLTGFDRLFEELLAARKR